MGWIDERELSLSFSRAIASGGVSVWSGGATGRHVPSRWRTYVYSGGEKERVVAHSWMVSGVRCGVLEKKEEVEEEEFESGSGVQLGMVVWCGL